jgi:hypothetical protein
MKVSYTLRPLYAGIQLNRTPIGRLQVQYDRGDRGDEEKEIPVPPLGNRILVVQPAAGHTTDSLSHTILLLLLLLLQTKGKK